MNTFAADLIGRPPIRRPRGLSSRGLFPRDLSSRDLFPRDLFRKDPYPVRPRRARSPRRKDLYRRAFPPRRPARARGAPPCRRVWARALFLPSAHSGGRGRPAPPSRFVHEGVHFVDGGAAEQQIHLVGVDGLALDEHARHVVEHLAVFGQQFDGALVRGVDDGMHFLVDEAGGLLRVAAVRLHIPAEEDGIIDL